MKFDFVKNINTKFNSFTETINGSSLVSSIEQRRSALENFTRFGIPTSKNEDWKYTPLNFLNEYDFNPVFDMKGSEIEKELVEKYNIAGNEANVLVFVNGIFEEELSKINKNIQKGLFIGSLKDAVAYSNEYAKIIQDKFGDEKNSFVNLNEAFFLDGAFVYVPDGYHLKNPIHILMLVDASKGNVTVNQKNVIIADEGSSIKVIETAHVLGKNVAFMNNLTFISAYKSSVVNYIKYQNDEGNLYNIGQTFVEQDDNSSFLSNAITLKSKFVRNTLNILHKGERCESNLYGLYFQEGHDFADNHTLVDHAKPDNTSNETYKGIIGGHAHAVFDGRILVRPDAQHTESYQSNKNILLSDDATINTKPQLEIYADDVKCSHGATSGSIDEDALFYLRVRGIDEKKARALLLDAFAGEIIDKITVKKLRKSVKEHIQNRLGIDDFDICHLLEN